MIVIIVVHSQSELMQVCEALEINKSDVRIEYREFD